MEPKVNIKRSIHWILLILMLLIATTAILIANNQYKRKLAYIAKSDLERTIREKEVTATFDTIEANLVRIRQHEDIIRQNVLNMETSILPGQKERIQQEIRRIEQLLKSNNELIAGLNDQLKEKSARLVSNELAIKDLRKRMEAYKHMVDGFIAENEMLQSQLNTYSVHTKDLEKRISHLSDTIGQQSDVIHAQHQQLVEKANELHTAYYKVGTYKSLRDQGILEKEGGFLGINQVKMLASHLESNQFQKIDTRMVTEILVQASRCEIITDQEPSSYEWIKNEDFVESIRITDPDRFWSVTRYLVIVVRENQSNDLVESR